MTIPEIIEWLKTQSPEIISEFKDGAEFYRWGEDIPDNSIAFENGWRFARLQHAN